MFPMEAMGCPFFPSLLSFPDGICFGPISVVPHVAFPSLVFRERGFRVFSEGGEVIFAGRILQALCAMFVFHVTPLGGYASDGVDLEISPRIFSSVSAFCACSVWGVGRRYSRVHVFCMFRS